MINTFFSETFEQHQPQVGVYSHADIPKAILIKKFVFVLYVRVLPDVERESFTNYDPMTSSDQWYNNENVVLNWLTKLNGYLSWLLSNANIR